MRKENASTLIHLNIFAFLIGSNPWLFLHNQLAYIKLGGGLRYPEKWHQSPEIVTATEKHWNEVVLAGLMVADIDIRRIIDGKTYTNLTKNTRT